MSASSLCQLRCASCGNTQTIERAKLPALPFTARCLTCSVPTTFTHLPGSAPDDVSVDSLGYRTIEFTAEADAPLELASPARVQAEDAPELVPPRAVEIARGDEGSLALAPIEHDLTLIDRFVAADDAGVSQGLTLAIVVGLGLAGISALMLGGRAANVALPYIGARDIVVPAFAWYFVPLVLTSILFVQWLLGTRCAGSVHEAVLGLVRGVVSPLTAPGHFACDTDGRRQLRRIFVPLSFAVWSLLSSAAFAVRARSAFACLMWAVACFAAGLVLLRLAVSFLRLVHFQSGADEEAVDSTPLGVVFETLLAGSFGAVLGCFS